MFDFSDYLKDSKFYNVINKKVLGKIKDEFRGSVIIKFLGLKSKMNFVDDENGKKVKKRKRN